MDRPAAPRNTLPAPPSPPGRRRDRERQNKGRVCAHRIEWPTLALAAVLYLAFGLVTWFHAALPWWALLAAGGCLVAWHGSLQHEVVHGHPTPWPWLNRALVLPSLWLWLPFEIYRDSHLAHHDDAALTDPAHDPESYYLDAAAWQAAPGPLRGFFWLHNTLLGRLLLGPPWCVARFAWAQARRTRQGREVWREIGRVWALHALGVGLVLGWVMGVAGLSLWSYLLLFVYPGIALTLLRSFLEHQARPAIGQRTVIVEAGAFWSLLFLNNNLHAAHHRWPGAPWYRLPARYRRQRAEILEANGDYRFSGYAEVICRYLLWPKENPVHPSVAHEASPPDGRRPAGTPFAPAET